MLDPTWAISERIVRGAITQAALVSPDKDVLPENRSVRLVTNDGKTVTGRLLNQDGFSVQLIDSSSQLESFQKAGLREFTIVTANPMPSYADKMSAQDLTDLVHYLSSLKGEWQLMKRSHFLQGCCCSPARFRLKLPSTAFFMPIANRRTGSPTRAELLQPTL